MLSFIVQARLGSTRLPGKILLPFHNDDSIFDLLLKKLKSFYNIDCVVATSVNVLNDELEEICENYDIKCYRGSENDVLQRFIDAAEANGIDRIIRICSDNPFLDKESIQQLIDKANESTAEYISFNINGTPSIKTHYGFWAEYVSLNALKKIKELTNELLYHEHVTNYIYSHPNDFDIEWIQVDESIINHKDIRLTIDTLEDFNVAQQIYNILGDNSSIAEVLDIVDCNKDFLNSMQNQIKKNSK